MAHLTAAPLMATKLISAQQLVEKPLHVASLVIHVRPNHLSELKLWLLAQDGVEIHAESEQGKLVVVMETQEQQKILDLIDGASLRPGALNAALVYHEILTEEHGA
jgi:nitrate reductase NapD